MKRKRALDLVYEAASKHAQETGRDAAILVLCTRMIAEAIIEAGKAISEAIENRQNRKDH